MYRNCLSQGAQALLRLAATLVHTVNACVRCCAPRGRTSCARNSVWACAVPERKSEGAQQFMADMPSTCVAPEQLREAPRDATCSCGALVCSRSTRTFDMSEHHRRNGILTGGGTTAWGVGQG